MTIRLNKHLRLCINGPEISYGGLQVVDQNVVDKECWSLYVAINNMNLEMLQFLWQDLGNNYNVSVGTGYGNLNSAMQLELGQDKIFKKKGVHPQVLNLMQKPIAPGSEQTTLQGNENKCKLWD